MLCALRSGAHTHLGFGRLQRILERLFGYKPRSTEEKLRVAEALEHLPELDHAFRNAEALLVGVRELTRVATPRKRTAMDRGDAGKEPTAHRADGRRAQARRCA